MNLPCLSSHIPSSCHSPVAKTILVASAALLLIIGIWQLSSPFIGKSPAAGWAFIGVAGLEVGFVIFLIIQTKGKAKNASVVPANLPDFAPVVSEAPIISQAYRKKEISSTETWPLFPKDIWSLIFSFVNIDILTLGRLEQVCKHFYSFAKSDEFWTQAIKNSLKEKLFKEKVRANKHYEFLEAIEKKQTHLDSLFKGKKIVTLFYAEELLFLSYGGKIEVWKFDDVKSSSYLYTIPIDASVLFYRENTLFAGSGDGFLTVLTIVAKDKQWTSRRLLNETGSYISVHGKEITCFTYGNDTLFSGSRDNTIKLWKELESSRWKCIKTIDVKSAVYDLIYENKSLVACTSEGIKLAKQIGDTSWVLSDIHPGYWSVTRCSGHILIGSGNLDILKADKDGNYNTFQTIDLDAGPSVVRSLYGKGSIVFLAIRDYLKTARIVKESGGGQWRFIESFDIEWNLSTKLFYAEGKLFAHLPEEIKVWSV